MLRRHPLPFACALAGLVLGLVLSGCTLPTSDNGGGYGPSNKAGGQAPRQADQPAPVVLKSGVPAALKARDSSWTPANYMAAPGASIILKITNSDSMQHNFTLDGEGISQNLPTGQLMQVRFTAPGPGRHRFYCKYQREEMQGWITVK
jgi:plastocyanin